MLLYWNMFLRRYYGIEVKSKCSSTWTVEDGWTCYSNLSSLWTRTWGNGVYDGGESWDDNNGISGDGCSSTCQVESNYIWSTSYSSAQKKKTLCAKKDPCAKKKNPVLKNDPRRKNFFVKIFIFFVDKLNMIDFNIFNMLKLIFTCESVAYLLRNSFVNVSFNSTLFLSCLLLWLSLWILVSSLSALFCVVSSRHSFLLSSLK